MTGQEERDVLFARLFGFTAIVQSGLLVRTKPLPTSASSATLASTLLSYQEVVNQLLELGEAKSWIRESVWWTLCLAIDALRDSDAEWKDEAIQFTIGKIIEQSWSPEKVALTLKLQELCPDYEWKSHLSPVFKKSTILHTNNLHSLAKILKVALHDSQSLLVLMHRLGIRPRCFWQCRRSKRRSGVMETSITLCMGCTLG